MSSPHTTATLASDAPQAKGKASQLPGFYPDWARRLAESYFSGSTSLFVLHGNVHDLVRYPVNDAPQYHGLSEFLTSQLFGRWDIVLSHDLSRGLRPQAVGDTERLRKMMQYLTARWGEPAAWPREPDKLLLMLDNLVERVLVDDASVRPSIAVIFEYAQYLVPAGDLESLARGQAARLVRFLSWAQSPHIRRINMAFCLIVDKLPEVNDRLVQSPYVTAIDVPLPDETQRRDFIDTVTAGREVAQFSEFPAETLADMANGLSLVNLNVVLSQAVESGRPLDSRRFRELKKTMIERQCQGLIEFLEPAHTLDLVVGHEESKQRLRQDAKWIASGQLEVAPMGYLICGPVGTGKTFLAECYAGSIGIPSVVLRNFRSKYVGETEGNLEQVLTVLRSLGPVVVIVDEADAALGNREAGGDSGTSARVFSMIANQMGNTRYRGKIIWMLLTSRPDLLPIDLKRQGRAEVHIPLFYPHEEAELRSMFTVMARKNKLTLASDAMPEVSLERRLSGADIESIVLAAKRIALADERIEISKQDLERADAEFIPSAQGLEKELQEIAAVLECTQLSFLPPDWRKQVEQPDGRSRLQERLVAIRQLLEN